MKKCKVAITLLISFCILGVEILPGYSAGSSKSLKEPIRIALLGIDFTNIPTEISEKVSSDIQGLLQKESELFIISEDKVQSYLNSNRRAQNYSKGDIDAYRLAAHSLGANYVLGGKLVNTSNSEKHVSLVGSLYRYDLSDDKLYELPIQNFYENFSTELKKIDEQLIQSILLNKNDKKFKKWPLILIGAATLVAVTILLKGTGGQGSGSNFPSNPPFTQ